MSNAQRYATPERKAMYKASPAGVRDSQEARRKKALEEQKRRRAERFDSSRQLDFFADLNLGPSDDEDDNVDRDPVREGVAQFAFMLAPATSASTPTVDAQHVGPHDAEAMTDDLPTTFSGGKKKGKGKRKAKARTGGGQKAQSTKPNSKWADKCMYAELLEMTEDTEMSDFGRSQSGDGIPSDLESAWVAVTPVPMGKRCLAITHAPSGIAGVVPNTTLRSRVLGKSLMKSFPSSLPPHTVVDCILDENWRDNGILHVLDIVKWKGQDIADCETPFRFWWRDTRLSELASFPPPSSENEPSSSQYRFSYPTTLLAVPYHSDLSLTNLANALVPLSRSSRTVPISVPIHIPTPQGHLDEEVMEVENAGPPARIELKTEEAIVHSDGMLLYVAQASYEPGTSPLSLWVPIRAYNDDRSAPDPQSAASSVVEGPLATFERLIKRRLTAGFATIHDPMEA